MTRLDINLYIDNYKTKEKQKMKYIQTLSRIKNLNPEEENNKFY